MTLLAPSSLLARRAGLMADDSREIIYGFERKMLPPGATFLRILAVNYAHLKTEDDGDMYVTEHGLPFLEHLKPANWYDPEWFQSRRERLHGTSTVYKVPTKPVPGRLCESLDLVVKWSRVGEDVPLNTFTLAHYMDAEFNSPFEEFSLVEELRAHQHNPSAPRVCTQKPLAIYVPPERMQLWQTGRSRDRILRKVARHACVEIDILRSYILLYGWIKGVNSVDAYKATTYEQQQQQARLTSLTNKVETDLRDNGFFVADHKPTHFILRVHDNSVRCQRDGSVAYAIVDYELLSRTPEHEEKVKAALRSRYLLLQRDRFAPRHHVVFPPQLQPANVLGVDYIYGRAESTGGVLWVVGCDPDLYNYFLPERWRQRQIQLSRSNRTWYTETKDRIHLVWKVSRVGDLPPGDLRDPNFKRILLQGYNSPFEEFALALEMNGKGIKTSYPRAIYVTGQPSEITGGVMDARRFDRMRNVYSPEGLPILQIEPDYITIWGYWRGLEDNFAPDDRNFWTPIDAASACAKGIITADQEQQLIERHRGNLATAGYEDANLKGDHILLSYIPGGSLKRNEDTGEVEMRHCNMEMVRRL